jgi:hypothetical protein
MLRNDSCIQQKAKKTKENWRSCSNSLVFASVAKRFANKNGVPAVVKAGKSRCGQKLTALPVRKYAYIHIYDLKYNFKKQINESD